MLQLTTPLLLRLQANIARPSAQMQISSDSKRITQRVNVAVKRACLVKLELLRRIDRFGKQLPVRLLAEILSFGGALELTRSQAVCSGWKLPRTLLNRTWRTVYNGHWEASSGDLLEIAPAGAETPWLVRYQLRDETEAN